MEVLASRRSPHGVDRSDERIPESDGSGEPFLNRLAKGCLRLNHSPSTFVILAGARQRVEGAPRIGMEMFNVSTEKTTSKNGDAIKTHEDRTKS